MDSAAAAVYVVTGNASKTTFEDHKFGAEGKFYFQGSTTEIVFFD